MGNLPVPQILIALSLSLVFGTQIQPASAQAGKQIGQATPRTAQMSPQQWFATYDRILAANLVTPAERQQLEDTLTQGVAILINPQVKANTQNMLNGLIGRYDRASAQLKAMPAIAPTSKLQQAYTEYFGMGAQLFRDYLKVVDNPVATNTSTGTPLLTELQPRKEQLANIKEALIKFDLHLRGQLGIPATGS